MVKKISEDNIIIKLQNRHYDKLVIIAEKAYPNECIALLFGNITIEGVNQKYIYDVKKIDEFQSSEPSPVAFLIGDYEILAQKWFKAQQLGLKLICVYHSHPSTAYPSGMDKTYMKQLDKLNEAQKKLEYKLNIDKELEFIKPENKKKEKEIKDQNKLEDLNIIWVIYGNRTKELNAFILHKGSVYQCIVKVI